MNKNAYSTNELYTRRSVQIGINMDKGYISENWKDIYEERMAEIKKELNIYPSSPEAVILESITGFTSIQMEKLKNIADGMEEKLINLAGFYREKNPMKSIYVEARGVEESFLIPACQKFKVGSLCFESERSREISGARLIGVYAGSEEGIKDFSYVLKENAYTDGEIFGRQPMAGMELYFVFDRMPELDRELTIYAECKKNEINLRTCDTKAMETKIEWECYTGAGYESIECVDETENFNQSGSLTFRLGKCKAERIKSELFAGNGYIIRGTLSSNSYIECPKIKSIRGLVFPLIQKDTKAYVYTFAGQRECYIYSDIMEEQYVRVYCRRQGEILYSECDREDYDRIRQDYGRYCYRFNEIYENIAVAVYDSAAVKGCDLGYMYGYDHEEFELAFDNIIGGSFGIILEIKDRDGRLKYDFVRPQTPGAMGFVYELDEREGKVKVINAGECAGSRLYAGETAVAAVTEGILLKDTELIPSGYETEVRFLNAADTSYGGMEESLENLKKRFVSDVYRSYTAVAAEDYEDIVMGISGINAERVKAVGNSKENKVSIAVYINGMKPGDRLSDMTKNIIMKEINKKRLLSTRIALISPVFTAVNVNAVIAVKGRYEYSEKQIREAIEQLTDYIRCGKGFGELLLFEEVYRTIQRLQCVSYIVSFDMSPGNYIHASVSGSDIKPADNCLLMPGNIKLTLNYEKDGH